MIKRLIIPVTILLVNSAENPAQVPYGNAPGWISNVDSLYSTGCAVGDINGDGFLDMAVSNGNDMLEAYNLAYINNNGFMPNSAAWTSQNFTYSGHCDFGDFDSDGFPELAVANYISYGWNPNLSDVYDNNQGALESSPSWNNVDSTYSFRVAWGDADSDGDLDLAMATGDAYHNKYRPNLIYYNHNGLLQTSPGWYSADSNCSYDVHWVDVDLDGDLDLAFCESGGKVKIYMNYGDSIGTQAGTQTLDDDNYNSIDFADINGDGYPELGAAANIQTGGSGFFKIFANIQGIIQPEPFWISANTGFGSEAAFTDIDGDGDFDFVGGRWWGLIYVYLNVQGLFGAYPDWNSSGSYTSVIENIVFADFNNGGMRDYKWVFYQPAGQVIYLPQRQIAFIDSVRVDGESRPADTYCFGLWDGWVSTGGGSFDSVEVFYKYSLSKDMAVSNWDNSSYIFYNTAVRYIPGDSNDSGVLNGLDVIHLVAFLKGNGPPPAMRFEGDANGDCEVNGLDVVYLVNYFKGGPETIAGPCD